MGCRMFVAKQLSESDGLYLIGPLSKIEENEIEMQ